MPILKRKRKGKMTDDIKLRRYVLRKSPGWAVVVIGSDGYFSAVSDYGNYAFWWSAHGHDDFRKFLLRAKRSSDYFINCLSPKMEYDGEETVKRIKEEIISRRSDGSITRETARREWDDIEYYEVEESLHAFYTWAQETKIGDAWEMSASKYNADAEHFVKRVMGEWLHEVLIKELEDEAA